MRWIAVWVILISAVAGANEPALRPSARMMFAQPEFLHAGTCVMVREGGAGWIATDPVFWLKGTVAGAEVRSRRLEVCPEVPGKTIDRYSREEFVRLATARPCVSRPEAVREEQVGMVRVRVESWETPWARRAANAFRLYQGHYLDRPLSPGLELEIEADLLSRCEAN
ncbi:MAG TPA: hypothetical protein PKD04_05685 [Rhodocyclaceae bacterium]|jgi:hypothetical protein|nr:hypothetical protein [Rhodocyclaceae bacterium]HMV20167.1 hypothetical protein [Rhodocyclaceae bacterium]HMW76148.1 hypothetical protein [Rhodocyclaceae bacterium]HNE43391.1 hypothetical protein [Rhodocyclaceae bacterium]HNL21154.1 hypothetical protein [Rhodocyclaceae bacterium]